MSRAEIDFSQAPAGYPIWIEAFDGESSGAWHRDDGDRYTDQHGCYWMKREGTYRVFTRPEPVLWDGSGLPPVGTECDRCWSSIHGAYHRVKVLAHDGDLVVFRWIDGERAGELQEDTQDRVMGYWNFRPIRTPEQIAAEERAKAVAEMLAGIDIGKPWSCAELAGLIYDKGYRKPEGGAQ